MNVGHRKTVRHYDELGHCHELTFSCYRRMPLLTNNLWPAMLNSCVEQAVRRQGFWLVAFVFMPEHVHLLVYPVSRGEGGGQVHLFGRRASAKCVLTAEKWTSPQS